jgi:hypothetical protein
MNNRPGEPVPASGIYWCSVCKTPQRFEAKQEFPTCPNLCGKGHWELVEKR